MEYDIYFDSPQRPQLSRQFSHGMSHRYDPVTIGLIVAGSITAVSQVQEGRAAKAQGKAEKKIAEFNAIQKEREARSRVQAASIAEERVSKQEKITKAQQRADFAKGGITLEGSPLDVLAETAGEFATERALTLREGTVASSLLKGEASMLRATGQLAADIGRQKQTASFIKAGGTIIGTAAAVGSLGTSVASTTANQSTALAAGQGPLSTSAANTFVANANAPIATSSFAPQLFTLR